jgi:long-chain acyl-CoA synthetase
MHAMQQASRTGTDTNLIHAILRHAIEHPDRLALIDAVDAEKSVTFGRLRQGILRRAQFLRTQGLRPGQMAVLNTSGGSQIDDLLAFLALTAIGVGVYASAMQSDVERQVAERLGINRHVVSRSAGSVSGSEIAIPVWDDSDDEQAGVGCDGSVVDDASSFPWLVRSSSGTTGAPKIFITTHEQGAFRRERYYSATGLAGHSLFMSLPPIRFGAARQRVFYALSQGASVVVPPTNAVLESMLQFVRDFRVTHLYCVPVHLALCCDYAGKSHGPLARLPLLPHLANLESSSSIVTPRLAASVRSLVAPNFSNSYSVSEIGHISTTRLCGAIGADAELNNVGVAVDGVEIAIVDGDLKPLARGERGLIAVRFPQAPMQVACLDPAGQWVSEIRAGYFLPGDIGYLSPSGNLIFECRADDMMIFDGINIYPREIESVLETHPAVVDAAAFPVPSVLHGTIPVAAVTLRSPLSNDAELMNYCRARLGVRSPQHVAVLQTMPRNQFGKILKRELSSMFREQ